MLRIIITSSHIARCVWWCNDNFTAYRVSRIAYRMPRMIIMMSSGVYVYRILKRIACREFHHVQNAAILRLCNVAIAQAHNYSDDHRKPRLIWYLLSWGYYVFSWFCSFALFCLLSHAQLFLGMIPKLIVSAVLIYNYKQIFMSIPSMISSYCLCHNNFIVNNLRV